MTYGLAEFVAAEEMVADRGLLVVAGRRSGCWSRGSTPRRSPRWYIADPANPGPPPVEVAYPAAGTANADVSVVLAGLDGTLTPVTWDSRRRRRT